MLSFHLIIYLMAVDVRVREKIDANFALPGSKSIGARALLLSALAEGRSTLRNIPTCRDFAVLLDALKTFGFEYNLDESNRTLSVTGTGGRIPSTGAEISVEDNGTALRLLTAFCTLGYGTFVIDGTPRLRQRPIRPLVEALGLLGARVSCTGEGAPVTVKASGLPGGEVVIDCSASSQFLSALLIAGPFSKDGLHIHAKNLVSKPYVEITLQLMERFGLNANCKNMEQFTIPGSQTAKAADLTIESDASSAAYFFAAAALCGGRARIESLPSSSRQADVRFVDVLARMGADIEYGSDYIEVRGTGNLTGIEADLSDFPDSVPVLAAIAPFASSPTLITNVPHLRLKESDRLSALQEELTRYGVRVESGPDWLKIHPSEPHGAAVQSHNDHRIAMAFAVLGLRAAGVSIEGAECVSKSFPEFFDYLEKI